MQETVFDIFRGRTERDAMWLEAVAGLSNARERMEIIASLTPGPYFLYSSEARSILSTIQTFEKPKPPHTLDQ